VDSDEGRVSSYFKPNWKEVTSICARYDVSKAVDIEFMVFWALKMEAAWSSTTLVSHHHTTWHSNTENHWFYFSLCPYNYMKQHPQDMKQQKPNTTTGLMKKMT
jgi:hypothetical protein